MKLLTKLDAADKYCLIVTQDLSSELKLASRNLPLVSVSQAKYLNTAKLLDSDYLLITKPALDVLSDWLSEGIKHPKKAKLAAAK